MDSDSLSPSLSKLLSAPPNIQPIKVEESMIPNRLSEASAEPSAFPLAAAALPSTSSPLLPTLLPLPLLLNLTNSASAFDPTTLYLQSLLLGEFIKQQTENCNVILNTLQAKSMVSSPSTSVQPSPTEIPKNSPSFPRKAEKSKTDKAKNYPCIICVVCKEKICARSRRLHIEAHFSYQPHSCSVCGFAARKSIIVQLHVNKMHRGNGQVITKVDEKIEAEVERLSSLSQRLAYSQDLGTYDVKENEVASDLKIRPLKNRNSSVSSSTVFERKWDNEGRAERAAMARSSSLLGDFRVQKKVNENGEREREDSLPQIMDKMQSSKHQVPDKAKKAMMSLLSLKNTNAKSENYQIFKEDDQVSSGGPAYGPKPSKKGKRIKHTRADSDTDVTGNLIGRDDSRLVVAGIPDMSDPCFRRYANCIIVNAQPYERRSTTGLITCKAHCLQSQSSAYNCRSFIYDNINQVAQLPD